MQRPVSPNRLPATSRLREMRCSFDSAMQHQSSCLRRPTIAIVDGSNQGGNEAPEEAGGLQLLGQEVAETAAWRCP